jgi:hypothetical protein
VNIFNVRYIDQVAQWLDGRPFNFVYWNMMHDAWYFSIANLPGPAKQAIQEHLNSADIPQKYQAEFQRIIEFMTRGPDSSGEVLLREIANLDRRREQNLNTAMPELAKMLNYVGP